MYNILICDDEEDIVNALKIYLSDASYRLFEAYTGREAIEVMGREAVSYTHLDVYKRQVIMVVILLVLCLFHHPILVIGRTTRIPQELYVQPRAIQIF